MSSGLLTVLRSLHLANPRPEDLRTIGDAEWRRLLPLTDRSQLTLPLGVRCSEYLPEWVRQRIAGDLANNAIRQQRIAETYRRIASTLAERGLEFAVLKGFSHYPLYCSELRHRPQYDLDLYCPPEQIERAYAELRTLGYEPFGNAGRTVLDHLPPLILKTGWRAKNDYYDPDIPITIELHFRFWDAETERFNVAGSESFWQRRETRRCGDLSFPGLHPADAFSYAAWHLVRHLLRGDVRAYHVYEIAQFLDHTAAHDSMWRDSLWKDWRDARPSPLAETIACRLAVEWFGCRVHPVMQEFLCALPVEAELWFEMFGLSPLSALEHPNKDELLLHLCLVDGMDDRLKILKRRLLPRRASPYIADVHVAKPDLRLRLKRRLVGTGFVIQRTLHHLRTFGPLLANGVRWRRALAGLPPPPVDRTLHAEIARH